MTLVNAIKELMKKGITNFPGWTAQAALENAIRIEETAKKVIETGIGDVKSWQYTIDNADNNYIVETNGHYIIATRYISGNGTPFSMATYGDYENEKEMYADFKAWELERDAEEIADKMEAERPNELPRVAWLAIARAELKAAAEATEAAFKRDFPDSEN